jgi:FkbM family methyltransferase
MAISEKEGKQPLHLSWNQSEDGWASLLEATILEEPAREHRTLEVMVKSIDGFVSSSNTRRVDLIKIDTEGSELHALRGGRQTIERYHPAIIFELNETLLTRDGAKVADVVQFLTDQGYSLHSWMLSTSLRPS